MKNHRGNNDVSKTTERAKTTATQTTRTTVAGVAKSKGAKRHRFLG